MLDLNKTYVGIVEDNQDPEKAGRVKVRVMDVFDDMEVDDIPWATPWKDLNGNEFNVPEKGKIVMVVFDSGNPDSPEFIYSDHYNINLENKLKSLSGSDYTSMKSIIFDHKTQIYVNDSEGLKIDHKWNNVNITNSGIDFNLKDNNSNLNIGDSGANQQVILGNHWLEWFDDFVENLLGEKTGPYFGNLGAPVVPAPSMAKTLIKYKALRRSKFLSNHVNIVDNFKIKTVLNSQREDTPQYGDNWSSTTEENTATALDNSEDFSPEEPENMDENVEKVISFIEEKRYKLNEGVGILNILALRNKDNGQITNKFDDVLYVVWKKESGNWEAIEAPITTVPGFIEGIGELYDDEVLLATGQYIDELELKSNSDGDYLYFKECFVHVNDSIDKYNWNSEKKKVTGVKILPANRLGSSDDVFESAGDGSQVFKTINHYNQFINLCKTQITKYKKNTFTYTLALKTDFEKVLLTPPKKITPPAPVVNITPPAINNPIEENSDTERSVKEYTRIVNEINKIYNLSDKFANGVPLFKDRKGLLNDDENGAVKRLREILGLESSNEKWFNKLPLDNLTDEHKILFNNQLEVLIKATTTSKKVVSFLLPNLVLGERSKSIAIRSDF